jgi:hypothetical protein
VAFRSIDDLAFPGATSDGPHASAVLGHLQECAEAISGERVTMAGHGFRYALPLRIGSPYPAAWLAELVYVPCWAPTIRVDIRVSSVPWSVDTEATPAEGTNAIRLAATTWCEDGRWKAPRSDEWTTLVTDAVAPAAQTVSLTARLNGYTGWVAVLVWTWSYSLTEGLSAEDLQGRYDYGALDVGGLGSIATHPPERAITISPAIGKAPAVPDQDLEAGPLYWVQEWEAYPAETPTDWILYTLPVYSSPSDSQSTMWGSPPQIHYWIYGIAVVMGWSCRVQYTYDGPGPVAYETDRPCSGIAHQRLVTQLNRMVRERTPIYSGSVGQPYTGTTYRPWLRDSRLQGQQIVSTPTYRALGGAMVPAAPAGCAGYEICVLVDITRDRTNTGGARAGVVRLKLAMRDTGSAAPAERASASTQCEIVRHDGYGDTIYGYTPGACASLAQCGFLADIYDTCQTQGCLVDSVAAGWSDQLYPIRPTSDFLRPVWITCTISQSALGAVVYPTECRAELCLDGCDPIDVTVLAVAVRALPVTVV